MPNIVSQEEWLQARRQLLQSEKEHTRLTDKLTKQRSGLPMTLVKKNYKFTGSQGEVKFLDLFEDKSQLIVHHVMFAPEAEKACIHCGYHLDNLPDLKHLHEKNTMYVVTARAPYEKLQSVARQFPVYSTYGSDFNYDYHVTLDKDIKPTMYNYKKDEGKGELPGVSVFYRDGDKVYHTYSTYARGVDHLLPTLALLDLTPLGRQD